MILVIVQHALAVAVVVLQHDELVGVVVDAVPQLHDGVEVQVPPLALDQRHVQHPLVVRALGLETGLRNTHIIQDILVVLAVDNRYPEFGVCHQDR